MKTMCQVLHVSESGYHAWYKRAPSRRQVENEQLAEQIRQAYDQGRHVYGSPRVHAELRASRPACWEVNDATSTPRIAATTIDASSQFVAARFHGSCAQSEMAH